MLYGIRALNRICYFIIQVLRTEVQIWNGVGKITNSGLKQSKGFQDTCWTIIDFNLFIVYNNYLPLSQWGYHFFQSKFQFFHRILVNLIYFQQLINYERVLFKASQSAFIWIRVPVFNWIQYCHWKLVTWCF